MTTEKRKKVKLKLFEILPEIYEKAKPWIICILIIFSFVAFYFEPVLGPYREDLLFGAALTILAILFEILLDISKDLKIKPETIWFPTVVEAIPKIKEIVSHDKQRTDVKIIAVTGATTIESILPPIRSASPAKQILISMGILDSKISKREDFPSHWSSEIDSMPERVKNFKEEDNRVSIDLVHFRMLPVAHGLLINDQHLILGFIGWTRGSEKAELRGGQLPHYYFHKGSPEHEYYFSLFESWFVYAQKKQNFV